MSSISRSQDVSVVLPEPGPLHYLIDLHGYVNLDAMRAKRRVCGIYDISAILSKNLVVEFVENAEEDDCEGLYTLISDLDYVKTSLIQTSNSFVRKGQLADSLPLCVNGTNRQPSLDKEAGLVGSDSLEDGNDEDQRELSSPFSVTVDCCVKDIISIHNDHEVICDRVIERVLNLSQLVELNLSGCQLTEELMFGMQFGSAYNLKILNLDWLKLRRLHPSIGRLRSLTDLSIRYNRISDLPLTIRLLRNLRRLDITGNPFTRLPGAVYHLALESIEGLNDCPLNKTVYGGWQKKNEEISWRKPLVLPKAREYVDSLKEYCIQAAVGMDCWLLSLPERYCVRLSTMAETQGLCENCLKPVRKMTVHHESLGYTIHAQVAVFCGVRDVPFTFMACSEDCLKVTVDFLEERNHKGSKKRRGYSDLPRCEYELEFVQDLEELRLKRAQRLNDLTAKRAQGNRSRVRNDKKWGCVLQ